MDNTKEFAQKMIANGQEFVDGMDQGINMAIEKRDQTLQRDAQLGLLIKLHNRFDQLPSGPLKQEVIEIIEAEIVHVSDIPGLAVEIDRFLFGTRGESDSGTTQVDSDHEAPSKRHRGSG